MLSVFSLRDAAINEGATGLTCSKVPAYEFVGELSESTFCEMNEVILTEAASLIEFSAAADEALVEAVIGGMDESAREILVENVFKSVVEGFKKFIDKIIAAVKGMIVKLKAFGAKIMGKTSKWVSLMKGPIEKAKSKKGAQEFKATMHAWDEQYVFSGMADKVAFIDEKEINAGVKDATEAMKVAAQQLKEFAGKDPQDDDVKSAIQMLEKSAEESAKEAESLDEDAIKGTASLLGVTASDLPTVWKEVEKKATGGEKTEQAIYSRISDMLSVVENTKKRVESISKSYNDVLKALETARKSVENADRSMADVDKTVPSNVVEAARKSVNAGLDYATKSIRISETIGNMVKQKNLKYVQAMSQEYMAVLSKFANIRDKKD